MQTSPSLSSYHQDEFAETAAEVGEFLSVKLKLNDSNGNQMETSASEDQNQRPKGEFEAEEEEKEEDEEDFSFVCNDANKSPISADDAFQNGQIRPVFPLFNRELLVGEDSMPSENDWPFRPPVRKVFIESRDPSTLPSSSESEAETLAAGPYCAWSKKAVGESPDTCKKSSSTGFSKFFRFRDLVHRSNSAGRDAFVFLNDSTTTSTKREEKVEKTEASSDKKPAGEVKVSAGGGKAKAKAKKGEKHEKASMSAHFARNRALKEEDRRRSYLPYRPELVGFFTNVNGGVSRNVHPF